MIFGAAVGAGIAFNDDRLGFIGFLPAHLGASILFVVVALTPSYVGLIDPVMLDTVLDRVIIIALKSQFPFAIFFSFIGSVLGLYLGGKLSQYRT